MSIVDKSVSPPYLVSFSSKDRVSGTNASFQSAPQDLGINKYDSVCLVQASIPRSFYNIPSSNNTFTLTEGLLSATITIPVGSYTRINLQTVLATLLTSSSPNGWVYTISYPNSTQGNTFKYTFTVSGNSSEPSFIFTDSLFQQLGFEQDSTNTFTTSTLTSTNCINLAYITSAYITSDICQNAEYLGDILNYGSYPMMSMCYFQQVNYDLNTRQYNPSSLSSWTFSLVDSFDQLIDLNNIPWSFTLVFFQRANTHEIQKVDLQLQNEERLFEIQNKQENIRKQIDTGEEFVNNETDLIPQFPVLPYGSSSIVDVFLKPYIERDEIKEKKPEKTKK